MNSKKFSRSQNLSDILIVAMAILAITAFAAPSARAQATETILYSFTAGADGYNPVTGLVSDAAGNLYGTTNNGGDYTYGTLFELSPQSGGGWTEKVLHSFNWHTDGAFPAGTLIFDAAGNLYGTTSLGGAHDAGSVFEFSPKAGGLWTETILHQFGNGKDGSEPLAGLTFDAAGNLYGTTYYGGANDSYGTVFQLSPKAGGGWTEKILHSFNKNGVDGFYPSGSVTLDAAGNVYGTTQRGGSKNGGGIVFELVHQTGGAWAEKLLFTFEYGGKSPYRPYAGLTFDGAGNLYGTTFAGGVYAYGTVFQLTPTAGGPWTAKLLYSFNPNGASGDQPESNLVIDAAGNLYGTANRGGANGVGTVFELTPSGGTWTETTLHTFNNTNADGYQPLSGLTLDSAGNLYGTTLDGGATGAGTVFKITP